MTDLEHARKDDLLEDAMRQTLEDPLTKWRREAKEQEARFEKERAKRRRDAEPAPVNWDLRIAEAIAEERQHILAVMAETVAEMADRQHTAIADVVRSMQGELAQVKAEAAEQKVKICEMQLSNGSLREQLAGDHGEVIDLPSLPLRSRAN